MKIKIIKEVWMFEDDFEIGNVYKAEKDEDGDYWINDCLVLKTECEVVE